MNKKDSNLKKSTNIGLFLVGIFVGFSLVCNVVDVIQLIKFSQPTNLIVACILDVVLYAGIIFYISYGYKIPHSNFFKYIIIGFVVLKIVQKVDDVSSTIKLIRTLLVVFGCIGATYMSGRLDRIKQNIIIAIIVEVLFIAYGIFSLSLVLNRGQGGAPEIIEGSIQAQPIGGDMPDFKRSVLLNYVTPFFTPIQWGAIVLAYTTRYHLHKEAGLVDKK